MLRISRCQSRVESLLSPGLKDQAGPEKGLKSKIIVHKFCGRACVKDITRCSQIRGEKTRAMPVLTFLPPITRGQKIVCARRAENEGRQGDPVERGGLKEKLGKNPAAIGFRQIHPEERCGKALRIDPQQLFVCSISQLAVTVKTKWYIADQRGPVELGYVSQHDARAEPRPALLTQNLRAAELISRRWIDPRDGQLHALECIDVPFADGLVKTIKRPALGIAIDAVLKALRKTNLVLLELATIRRDVPIQSFGRPRVSRRLRVSKCLRGNISARHGGGECRYKDKRPTTTQHFFLLPAPPSYYGSH